ncbi:pilus assembly protein [Photobacterium profundum]|uniref:TadE/TadG family type IV pilus assembly protein n=1 Tax=Photobacterium profundum TaxID=74109 RepID=UPI003D0CDE6D
MSIKRMNHQGITSNKITSPRHQRGAAGIYTALALIPLFGMIFWALEGTRYIQKKNRLADATEAATLAITTANQDDKTYENQLATGYIQAYIRNITSINNIKIERSEGIDNYPTPDGNEEREYFQYRVTAKTNHISWLSSDIIPSFAPTETVANRALARNYPIYLGDKDIDIVFVSDFSGSMKGNKIRALKDAIQAIANEILVPRDGEVEVTNRIAFVPYNMRVQEKRSNTRWCITQLDYRPNFNGGNYSSYEDIDWSTWSTWTRNQVRDCSNGYYSCTGKKRRDARTVYAILNASKSETGSGWYFPDPYSYINFPGSVAKTFTAKANNLQFQSTNQKLYSGGMCSGNFWTIPLTSEKTALSPIQNNMSPDGGTSVYQGLIRGAQILEQGRPTSPSTETSAAYNSRIKMILMLSDGQEMPYVSTFNQLVNQGLCNTIKAQFNDSDQPLYMGVLGIEFDAQGQQGFKNCVGQNNITNVDDVDDLIKEILEMIKEGSKTDGISKLYYRHLES